MMNENRVRWVGIQSEAVKASASGLLSRMGFLSVPGSRYLVFPGFCDKLAGACEKRFIFPVFEVTPVVFL